MRVFDAAGWPGARAPCLPGATERQRPGTSAAMASRLYAAGWGMGGIKVFDPARDPRADRQIPGWPSQIGALTLRSRGPPGPWVRMGTWAVTAPPPTRSMAP